MSSQPRIGFLDLSAELRNEIYDHALVEGNSNENGSEEINVGDGNIDEPALLSASRQIRNEALPVYYGANKFHCSNYRSAERFLGGLGNRQLGALRTVHIKIVPDCFISPMVHTMAKGAMHMLLEDFSDTTLQPDALHLGLWVWPKQDPVWISHKHIEEFEVRRLAISHNPADGTDFEGHTFIFRTDSHVVVHKSEPVKVVDGLEAWKVVDFEENLDVALRVLAARERILLNELR